MVFLVFFSEVGATMRGIGEGDGGEGLIVGGGDKGVDTHSPTPTRIPGLKSGFRWQFQIVFRTKLTAHTAYERQDNPLPAPVTAIAVHPLVVIVTTYTKLH